MKLIPTASQTVGPFFSIGLAPLYQNAAPTNSTNKITIRGTVFDGNGKPIPDAVLEFWMAGNFVRVPTSEDGTFSAVLEKLPEQRTQEGKAFNNYCEVLIFMRGLLKPVYTRVYFKAIEGLKNDPALKTVPPERIGTLLAKPKESASEYEWNIFMQGENETVFFEH